MPASKSDSDWTNLLDALEFAQDRFTQWRQSGALAGPTADAIIANYAKRREQLAALARAGAPLPAETPLPPLEGRGPAARSVRLWRFVADEIRRLEQGGQLSLADAHACIAEADARMSFYRKRLEPDSRESPPPMVLAVAEPRRPMMEILLDPRSIQWFLAFGGGLFVLGLVLYLYTKGIFKDPLVVAACLGGANLVLLLGGWALLLKTRYQLAGRALTLLACLVMPLNLWFYHAQDLITLQGHLWVAGVVVCALYAASAWTLKDWMFVPVLMGGVAMTGLLLLADLGRFWEVAGPSTLLVVLGLIGIHVERAFAPGDGPFGRQKFGKAFFFSGQALLAAGLLLLLGAQLAGNWLHPLFTDLYTKLHAGPSPVVTETWGRLLALGLVVAGIYAWLYSDLVVRRVGLYIYLAAAGMLWAEVLGLELLHVHVGSSVILATLALTALAANLAETAAGRSEEQRFAHQPRFAALGLFLALTPVVLGVILHVRATSTLLPYWPYDGGQAFVGAMAATVVSCRIGAYLYRRTQPTLSAIYFFATALAELIGVAGLLRVAGVTAWDHQAPILMIIPIAHAVSAYLYRGKPWNRPVLWAGQAATGVMLLSSLVAAMDGSVVIVGRPTNLALAGFFAEAAVFFGLTAVLHRRAGGVYLATVTACAAIWQVLKFADVADEYHTLAFAVLGLALLIVYRIAAPRGSALVRAAFDSANGLTSVAFVAAVLLGLQRLAFHEVRVLFITVCATLTIVAILAAILVRHAAWRRWYLVMAVVQGLLTLLAVQALSTLTPWQKAELFCVAAGSALLVLGHAGWYREHEVENDLVSSSLGLGSLLFGGSLTIAVLLSFGADLPLARRVGPVGRRPGAAGERVRPADQIDDADRGDDVDRVRVDAGAVRPRAIGAGGDGGLVAGDRRWADLRRRAAVGRVPGSAVDIAGAGEESGGRVPGAELAMTVCRDAEALRSGARLGQRAPLRKASASRLTGQRLFNSSSLKSKSSFGQSTLNSTGLPASKTNVAQPSGIYGFNVRHFTRNFSSCQCSSSATNEGAGRNRSTSLPSSADTVTSPYRLPPYLPA